MTNTLDLVDVVVLGALVVAALAGFTGSGRGQGGRSVGSVVGAVVALVLGAGLLVDLVDLGSSHLVRVALAVGGGLALLALGAALGGALGRLVGTGLARAHLGLLDRVLGAAGSVAALVLVVVAVATVAPTLVGLDGSTVVQGLRSALPHLPAELVRAGGPDLVGPR